MGRNDSSYSVDCVDGMPESGGVCAALDGGASKPVTEPMTRSLLEPEPMTEQVTWSTEDPVEEPQTMAEPDPMAEPEPMTKLLPEPRTPPMTDVMTDQVT
jgi:hypothetical protein